MNVLIAAHDDLTAVVQKVAEGEREQLSPHERLRSNGLLFGAYVQFDFAYHQYLAGQLGGNVWKRIEHEIPLFLSVPGFAAWWEQDKPRFSLEFVQFVELERAAFLPPATIPTLGR